MATKKKLLQAAAGSAGGAGGLNVEEVFSTYLYEGNGDTQAIDNGINLGQSNDGYSAYFDGTGDIVIAGHQSDLTDFTVEGWVYFTNLGSNRSILTLGHSDIQLYYRSSSSNMAIYDTSAKTYSFTPSTSTWYHFALVRDSSDNSVELFIDGVSKGTTTSSAVVSGDLIVGGYSASATDPMKGFISNVRVSNTVRYSSNFTAPTSALTADSDTTLLILQDKAFVDNSGNNESVDPSGDVNMQGAAPFDAAEAGEGGLVWIKDRSTTEQHVLTDTERGATKFIKSNSTAEELTNAQALTSFNSNGFSIGNYADVNQNTDDFASWTFRKAPKFFDVVTYTGDGTSNRQISHNLGSVPAVIICKNLNDTENWQVYHKDVGNDKRLLLNETSAAGSTSTHWNNTTPTDTVFTVGSHNGTNGSGDEIVAYLFAHNDGDGDFGPDGDADIIKCGSYTGNGSTTGPEIDLGFEPQWILLKGASAASSWILYDTMRGMTVGTTNAGPDANLYPHSSAAEYTDYHLSPTPTGFQIRDTGGNTNTSGNTYIYIAIRRGPMAVPESGTDVFAMDFRFSSEAQALNPEQQYYSGFPVDMHLNLRRSSGGVYAYSRLQGGSNFLTTSTTDAEVSSTTNQFGSNEGLYPLGFTNTEDTTQLGHMWKRAPNFFDVVAWEGDGTTDKAVNHNLTVPPEMIWFKNRDDGTESWYVPFYGVSGITDGNAGLLNGINTIGGRNMSTQSPTSDTVYFGGTFGIGNTSGDSYIAYLFASLDGVSKIGTYTGNGSSQTIDCGFSSGARFILVKRVNFSTGDWYIWDTERGIVAGNDPHLSLNSTAAEVTTDDSIDPVSSGFAVNQVSATNINVSSSTYIFYAIA